ncbi:MAG: OmpH family outer membrane protein [Selenomonadaceae bacterium]|nr:OmpH family outer membrane protein [Selenomonadaceae bacterium]MBQ6132384.1 OmpH family outer membrane protein [Selenomonadaceae bacterium]MBQ7493355.1 OmpH family outer membrane protein [Selenomonadaceae bacterium]
MNIAKKMAAVALLASSLMIAGCGEGQIGSVDVEKVMTDAPRVKTLMEEAQGKITAEQKKFEQENANKQMTDEEALKAQMDFQRKLENINQGYATQIKSRIDVVVSEIAREKNIDVVINNSKNQKLIFHGTMDITQDVINKMQ